MIDHLSSYTTNYEAAKTFYEAALGALGYTIQSEMVASWDADFPDRRMCAFGAARPVFWVIEVREPATPRHVAFTAKNHDEVRAFHAFGIAAGGKDNGEPGPRPIYHEHYFGSFVLDPDGNGVEAVCHAPDGGA